MKREPKASQQIFRGAHAPSRADLGALAEITLEIGPSGSEKVRDREGAITSTRGACAPQL